MFAMKQSCFHRFGCLLLAAAAFGFLPAAYAQPVSTPNAHPPAPRRPCIIFIQCDGLGYGDLSCYGQTKFQTPNLDRLAAGGIRFTSYYAGDAASSPANAALMLGRDSTHLKQRADVDVPLAADDITVAQWLQQSGYHTALIGEWRLGGDGTSGAPWEKGFDEFNGFTRPDGRGKLLLRLHLALHAQNPAQAGDGTAGRFQRAGRVVCQCRWEKGTIHSRFVRQSRREFHPGQPTRPIQPLPSVFPAC